MVFSNKKAQTGAGAKILIAIVLFEIIMYIFVYAANLDVTTSGKLGSPSDPTLNPDDSTTTTSDLSVTSTKSWVSGFNISLAFELPWWTNLLYVTFLAFLLFLSIYMLIRG